MRKISIDDLCGNEVLARSIWSNSGAVLMLEGSIIKKEYIPRLKELCVEYILIQDDIAEGINIDELIDMKVKDQCQNIVKQTIESYSYHNYGDIDKIREVAEEIMLDILSQKEVIFNVTAIREKSEEIYSHSLNVCILSILISLKMKIPKHKVRDIAIGSILHDMGYNYMNFDYNDKNYWEYSNEERIEIERHVIYGYTALENEKWLSSVSKDIILSHHENIEGSGYPFHLEKDKIKIGSKIVAICNIFDKLVYGHLVDKMKVHEAIEYIISQSNITYDEEIVKVFIESVAAFPNGTMVLTNEDEVGIVLRQNNNFPARPVIRMIYNKEGRKYKEWLEKDLTKVLTLFIKDTV